MIKRSTSLLFSLIALFTLPLHSCGGEEELEIEVIEPDDDNPVNVSIRETFNSTHTIQFPGDYEGGLTEDGVGNPVLFNKRKADESVLFEGGFCDNSSPCIGTEYLESTTVNEGTVLVLFTNLDGEADSLDNQLIVEVEEDNVLAYFFYAQACDDCAPRNSIGRLFLMDLQDSVYKWAGEVSFDTSNQEEVLGIVGSVRREALF